MGIYRFYIMLSRSAYEENFLGGKKITQLYAMISYDLVIFAHFSGLNYVAYFMNSRQNQQHHFAEHFANGFAWDLDEIVLPGHDWV